MSVLSLKLNVNKIPCKILQKVFFSCDFHFFFHFFPLSLFFVLFFFFLSFNDPDTWYWLPFLPFSFFFFLLLLRFRSFRFFFLFFFLLYQDATVFLPPAETEVWYSPAFFFVFFFLFFLFVPFPFRLLRFVFSSSFFLLD